MKFVPALVLILISLTSCVTYRLQPLAQPGSEVRIARGQSLAVAEKDGVTVEASADWAPEIRLDLKVINKSSQTLSISSDQFRLYTGEPGSWKEVPFVSGAEYYRRAEADARSRPVVTIVTTDAPVYRRTTTSTTTITGSNGGGSVTIIRTDPQPVYEPAETRTVTIVPTNNRRLDWLKTNLFQSVTLAPGTDHSGILYIDPVRSTFYKLVLPIDGRDYEVVFERIREKGPFTNLN